MSQTNVVEPLQAILTLCVLAYMPVGSRVCIRNFQLLPDSANAYQGLLRWWFSDTRESMHCLFNAIRRFNQWEKMYNLSSETVAALRRNAYKGVTLLQTTYMQTERGRGSQMRSDVYVLDMLTMYQKLILNPDHAGSIPFGSIYVPLRDTEDAKLTQKADSTDSCDQVDTSTSILPLEKRKKNSNRMTSMAAPASRTDSTQTTLNGDAAPNTEQANRNQFQDSHSSSATRIDSVFCKITKLYTQAEKRLIFSFLSFLEQPELSQNDVSNILGSLEYARKPMLAKTDAWIAQNMVAI
jgi:hypothetical protein